MARMVRKQLYIDERQERLLKERAELTGRTESDLIRVAIEMAYDPDGDRLRRAEALKSFLALGDRVGAELLASGTTEPAWEGREKLYMNARRNHIR